MIDPGEPGEAAEPRKPGSGLAGRQLRAPSKPAGLWARARETGLSFALDGSGNGLLRPSLSCYASQFCV
jgi:hypothetical protein